MYAYLSIKEDITAYELALLMNAYLGKWKKEQIEALPETVKRHLNFTDEITDKLNGEAKKKKKKGLNPGDYE